MKAAVRRLFHWVDDRLGISGVVKPILSHPVPRGVNWWYVFGSATLVAFLVQVITGVALAFTYVPAPNSAYESLQFITHGAILGRMIRGIHYFGASAMVILIAVHMARVFIMGSFKFPRELNWLTGVVLLALTLGMAFTGQLLRWDQNAYWSVVVAAAQAGRVPVIGEWLVQLVVAGQTVGGATLTRAYATHVFLIPALIFAFVGLHLWLVLRHGISEPPKAGELVDRATYRQRYAELLKRHGVPFWPDAAWRDVVFALAVGAVVVVLAVFVGPPELVKQADPTDLQAYPRPDWYFLWLFALLALAPPGLEDALIIGLPLLLGLALVALPLIAPGGERSPLRRPWAPASAVVTALIVGALVWEGHAAPWSPDLPPPAVPASVTQSLSGDALRGATLFQQKGCTACHAIAGVGGRRGPDLTRVDSRLSKDQIILRILGGGNGMPAFGGLLDGDQVASLVSFLSAPHDGTAVTGGTPTGPPTGPPTTPTP